MRHGLDDDSIHAVTRLRSMVPGPHPRDRRPAEEALRRDGLPVTEPGSARLKMMGFTDARLAV
jgi:carbamoyl-phosphate synthase large subunit